MPFSARKGSTMKTKEIKISELKHPEKNAREHPEAQIREIMRSLKEFGQTRPMLVDENNVVLIGNGLLEAMKAMGRRAASCIVVIGWSDAKKKKAMLADNKIFSMGRDNTDILSEIIKELDEDALDIPGFEDDFLENLRNFEENAPLDSMFVDYRMHENGELSPVDDYSNNSAEIDVPDIPRLSNPQKPRKFVVCPQCGEKIFI